MLGDNFARTLTQVRNGDEAAFAALYRAHNPALAGFLRRRSITAAEDLASETWIGVARGLERFEVIGWFALIRHDLKRHHNGVLVNVLIV